jgi:hypothetical protein
MVLLTLLERVTEKMADSNELEERVADMAERKEPSSRRFSNSFDCSIGNECECVCLKARA